MLPNMRLQLSNIALISLAFLMLIAYHPIGAQQNPTITFISKEKVVNIGDTTEL